MYYIYKKENNMASSSHNKNLFGNNAQFIPPHNAVDVNTPLQNLVHGRETYIVNYGDNFIMKRPLPQSSQETRNEWLTKQHRTKNIIDAIHTIGNPRYYIPRMEFINDDEFQLLEERAPGEHLTAELFKKLSQRQKYEIIDGIAAFLVDMNESKPVQDIQNHQISSELKFNAFSKFLDNKMSNWFTDTEVTDMLNIRDSIINFKYDTHYAWAHRDLNPGNVLYDAKTSTLSFIDFAEANYDFIYHDIFSPLQIELGICKSVYQRYYQLHDKQKYSMPSPTNEMVRHIMKHRMMFVFLRRFIKAADDLRPNTQTAKGRLNNANKVAFMREQLAAIKKLEKQFSK